MEYVDAINCEMGGADARLYASEDPAIFKECLQNDLHLLKAKVRHLGTDLNYIVLENLYALLKIRWISTLRLLQSVFSRKMERQLLKLRLVNCLQEITVSCHQAVLEVNGWRVFVKDWGFRLRVRELISEFG